MKYRHIWITFNDQMKHLYIVLFLFTSTISNSQVWIQKGAVWHYAWSGVGSGGFIKIEYQKDTLINSKVCKKLLPLDYEFIANQYDQTVLLGIDTMPGQFTYVNGDTVFYLVNGKFSVLYNFGAKPGDTWNLGVDTGSSGCSKSIAIVDSIGRIVINSVSYRWIYLSGNPNSSVYLSGRYVERFGAMDNDNFLFPLQNYCSSGVADVPLFSFNCFQDDSFPLYNVIHEDCEWLLTTGISSTTSKNLSISLYPNPTSGEISIESSSTEKQFLQIFDIAGKLLLSKPFPSGKSTIEANALPQGIYNVSISSNEGISNKKLVILK